MNTKKFVKWPTDSELEKLALKIRKQYDCGIPLDIDYLVEAAGLDLRCMPRLKQDFGVRGLLSRVKNDWVVFVQDDAFSLTNYETNFTIAEEFAHYILHKDMFASVVNFEEAYDFYINTLDEKSRMMMELGAKGLAAALLIPADDLLKKATTILKVHSKTLLPLVEDNLEDVINYISVPLSDEYQAPEHTVIFRLKKKLVGFKDLLKSEHVKFKKK